MNKILIAVLCLSAAGCASMTSVEKNFSMVDKSNGISMKEAVVIAQKHCLGNAECNGDVRLSTPDVTDFGIEWSISFWSKNILALDHAYVVMVDKKTGEIVDAKFAL